MGLSFFDGLSAFEFFDFYCNARASETFVMFFMHLGASMKSDSAVFCHPAATGPMTLPGSP